jgi:dTDP-4-dehydrorhamnose 3,5-epimerase
VVEGRNGLMQSFKFMETELKGAYLIEPFIAEDQRGKFVKDYQFDLFLQHGISHELKEVFYTESYKNVIRAIHFQEKFQQAKLVRCIHGKIYDVIVDLRPNSESFGQWKGFYLSAEEKNSVYIPQYFGHGYLVLEDSIVSYQSNEVFYGPGDSGIIYNDSEIGIQWPFELIGGEKNLIISEKDLNLQSLMVYKNKLDSALRTDKPCCIKDGASKIL